MRLFVILVVAVPALAHAEPMTIGVGVGMIQSASDVGTYAPNETLGVYGRYRFTPRLAVQLELQRLETDDQSQATNLRTATALLVVDLAASTHLVPILLVGTGVDDETTSYDGTTTSVSTDGYHFEGGFGLEYRAAGGLVIGADARMGGRSIESPDQPGPLCYETHALCLANAPAPELHDGGYRSVRMTIGVRF